MNLLFYLIPPGAVLHVFQNDARSLRPSESSMGFGLGLWRKSCALQVSGNKKCKRLGNMYVMALRAATLFFYFWGELQLISIVGLLILVKYS